MDSAKWLTDHFGKLDKSKETLRNQAGYPVAKKPKMAAQEKTEPAETVSDFGFTDINKFEHCARSLQKCLRLIVDSAPSTQQLAQLSANNSVDKFAREEIKNNELVHLVAKLKTLYDTGLLKVFDEILSNSVTLPSDITSQSAIAKETQPSANTGSEAPSNGEDLEHTSLLPPLPKIKNAHLRARVFQHKSTSANKTYLKEKEIVLAHNERIEFLGDSVLNTVITFVLYEKFPYANEGQLSQIRSLLVNNKTLAEFSVAYGFDQTLRCNIDENLLRTGKQKVYADIFEAYIGALAMERGYDLTEIQAWLTQLMAAKISAADYEMKKSKPINKDAKTDLYSLIGTAASHPIYKVVENGNGVNVPYRVQCVMEDVLLGEGVAPGLKEAGLRAAMSALRNKPQLEIFGRRRLETDRSVSVVKQDTPGGSSNAQAASQFPLVADTSVYPNRFAKNEVYAYFGKYLGLAPEYSIAFETESNRYKAELKVKEFVIAVAYDASRKNAMARAAAVVLDNKQMLTEIVNCID